MNGGPFFCWQPPCVGWDGSSANYFTVWAGFDGQLTAQGSNLQVICRGITQVR